VHTNSINLEASSIQPLVLNGGNYCYCSTYTNWITCLYEQVASYKWHGQKRKKKVTTSQSTVIKEQTSRSFLNKLTFEKSFDTEMDNLGQHLTCVLISSRLVSWQLRSSSIISTFHPNFSPGGGNRRGNLKCYKKRKKKLLWCWNAGENESDRCSE